MAIRHLDDNFEVLRSAFKNTKQVQFLYTDKSGNMGLIRGFILELTAKSVRIADVDVDGMRQCNFDNIASPVMLVYPTSAAQRLKINVLSFAKGIMRRPNATD
jgi:hypothetical protein